MVTVRGRSGAVEVEKLLSFAGAPWWRARRGDGGRARSACASARGEDVAVAVRRPGARLAGRACRGCSAARRPSRRCRRRAGGRRRPRARRRRRWSTSAARPRVAVLQLPGVNCEDESARAIAHVGGEAEIFRWTRPAAELAAFDGFLVPGGFSYQDRVRAGAVAAKDPLLEVLLRGGRRRQADPRHLQRLPGAGRGGHRAGPASRARWRWRWRPTASPGRRGYYCALGQPRRRVAGSRCAVRRRAWTDAFPVPMAHAEGRFTHEDPGVLRAACGDDGYVALRYAAAGRAARAATPTARCADAAA